jgi:hypothetical protein
MSFHTGSLFIGTLGMFEILMSFPVSIFIYRLFFQVTYLVRGFVENTQST